MNDNQSGQECKTWIRDHNLGREIWDSMKKA